MINKVITFWNKKQRILYAAFYIVAIIIFLFSRIKEGRKVEKLYSSGVYTEKNVTVHEFEMIDCEVIDDLTFKGKGDNAQLVYNGDIDTLYMDCAYSYGLREFKAYYNTTGDYVFEEENSMIPKQFEKYLIYDFPEGTKQVKMYYQNSTMYFNELIINCRQHTNKYSISTTDIFWLSVWPSVVYLLFDLLISTINIISKTRKK